jgi:hypothetical protein
MKDASSEVSIFELSLDFSPSTVAKILQIPVGNSSVKEELEKFSRRKVEREQQNEICAAHDLAPLFEIAFGLDRTTLKNEDALKNKANQKGAEKKGFGGTVGRGLKKARSSMFGKKKDGNGYMMRNRMINIGRRVNLV